MAKTEKYFVGPQLLGEIRQTITRVAGMPDRTSGVSLPVVHQELPRQSASPFRMATFTGSWSINTVKTVTLQGSTTTLQAYNVFATIGVGCGFSPVAIARDGTAWYAIAARCQ